MSQVSVIIPTLYPSSHLLEYAEKIRGYDGVKEGVVVNNNQETINMKHEMLRQAQHDKVKVIYLGKNKGFTGACNADARRNLIPFHTQ